MPNDQGFLVSWIGLTRRRWRTGAVVFGVVLALSVALLFLTRPVYRAEAAFRLGQPPPPTGVSPTGGMLSFLQPGGDPFANDLELLASRTLAEEVVDRVALNAALHAPRHWHRDSLLVELDADRDTDEASYAVRWRESGIEVRRESPDDSLMGVFPAGGTARFDGITAVFRPRRDGMPTRVTIRTEPFGEAVRRTRSALDVTRPRREANVVALAYDHTDPGVTQAVLMAAADEFMRLRARLHERESGETVDSLRTVARSTAAELRAAEDALERVQRESRLVAPEAQSEALVEEQSELMVRLRRAESELAGVDEMLRRLDASRESSGSWTALLSYPTFLANQTLGDLLSDLTRLHAERQELRSRRAPENRELRVLDEQMAYLDDSLRRLAREYRAGLREQIATLRPQVARFDQILEELPARAGELARRQRDVRLLTEVLVLTEQRLRQEEIREALTYANVQVIDPPALRARPVWPRKKLGLAVGLLLAGGFGLFGMVVRDRTDSRIRRVGQLRDAIDRPVLAVLEGDGVEGFHLSAIETQVLLRRAGGGGNGRRTLTLVPVHGEAPGAVPVARLAPGSGDGVGSGDGAEDPWREGEGRQGEGRGAVDHGGIVSAGPVRELADAVTIASAGAPAALLVEAGRTTAAELRHTARLIEEAGGTVAGVVLVCRRKGEARVAWT